MWSTRLRDDQMRAIQPGLCYGLEVGEDGCFGGLPLPYFGEQAFASFDFVFSYSGFELADTLLRVFPCAAEDDGSHPTVEDFFGWAKGPCSGSIVTSWTVGSICSCATGLGRFWVAIWRAYRSRPARRGSSSFKAMRCMMRPMEASMAERSSGIWRSKVLRRALRVHGLCAGLRVAWW